jgi:hypothetical protein
MKTPLMMVCVLALQAAPAWAQKAGDLGAGVVLGAPTGATAKYWLSGTAAIDGGLGYSDDLTVYADLLWHSWTVFPQPRSGKLPAYLGIGAEIRNGGDDSDVGLRAVAGVAYWLPRDPVEIFLELVPVFNLSSSEGVGVEAGIGLRYYFTR